MRVSLRAYWDVPVRCSGLQGVALLAAVVLLGVAGCGAGQRANGTLYGTVFGSGGPATFPPTKMEHVPLTKVTVIVDRVHSSVEFQTVTSTLGSFSLTLPPGTYLLRSECGKARPPSVRVASGAKIKRNIDCEFV